MAIEQEIENLKKYEGEDRVVHSFDLNKEIEQIRKEKPAFELRSKLPALDNIIKGFRLGNLITISGQTSEGKSELAKTLSISFSEQGAKPLWFSFELPYDEFFERFTTVKAEVPEFFLPRRITKDTWDWTKQRILEGIGKYGTNVVFIDDLGFLIPQGVESTRFIDQLIPQIKSFARNNRIIIFIIYHTKKTLYEKIPTLEDIRDSAMIAARSDTVLVIWRKRKKQTKAEIMEQGIQYTNNTVLKVAKNRRTGNRGFVQLLFNKGLFYEVTKEKE